MTTPSPADPTDPPHRADPTSPTSPARPTSPTGRPLPADVTLRRAGPADVEAGAALHRECWREAYPGLMAPEVLDAVLANHARRLELWERMTAEERPPLLAVHAAADGERLVGFAVSGAGGPDLPDLPDAPSAPDALPPLHLHAIYVRSAWWGTGIGAALLAAEVGDADCALLVLDGNDRAQAFYERHGFVVEGDPLPDPHLGVADLRMVRRAACYS